MNDYYGWNTSVNIQNTSDQPANITIYYYKTNGTAAKDTPTTATIPAYASRSYYSPNEGLPSSFIGSAKISAKRNIAVAVNQSTTNGARGLSYSGSLTGSGAVVVPDIVNKWGSASWVSSVNVRNLGTSSDAVLIDFNGTSFSWNVNAGGMKSVYIPDYWGTQSLRGPAFVWTQSGQPISVVVNQSSSIATNDYARSFNGLNR